MKTEREIEHALRTALAEEASTVQPDAGALATIRRRTADGQQVTRAASPRERRRGWVVPVAIAAASAAAVVTVVTVVGGSDQDGAGGDGGTAPIASGPTAAELVKPGTVPVYYVTEVIGNLTFRIVREGPKSGDPGIDSLRLFLEGTAQDPDYYSGWPAGLTVDEITDGPDGATVKLSGTVDLAASRGMNAEEAKAAAQAFAMTATDSERVRVTYNGEPVDVLFGQRIDGVLFPQPATDVMNAVQVLEPADGATTGDTVTFRGEAWVFEANVNWRILDTDGLVVKEGYATTATSARRSKFEHTVRGLKPGSYTYEAYESSPETGEETYTDTKTFTVQ